MVGSAAPWGGKWHCPPLKGPTAALGRMRSPCPHEGAGTPTPPQDPSFLQKVTGAVQRGGGCALQIGTGFGWNELRAPLQVVCFYRGWKGGALSPGLPHISPATTWGSQLCSQPCTIPPCPSATAAPSPLLAVASLQGHQGTAGAAARGRKGGRGHAWASGSPAGSGCSRQSSVAPRHFGACGRLGFRQLFCSHVLSAVAYQNSHFILKQQFFRVWGSCTDPPQKPGGCPGSGRDPRSRWSPPVPVLWPGSGLDAGLGAARRPAHPGAARSSTPALRFSHFLPALQRDFERSGVAPGQGVLRSAKIQHRSRAPA